MMTMRERVRLVREKLAEGKSDEEIKAELVAAGEDDFLVEEALRRARYDRTQQRFTPEEIAVLRAIEPLFRSISFKASILGRSTECYYKARAKYYRGGFCDCGGAWEPLGIPAWMYTGGTYSVTWALRCRNCGNTRSYILSWRESGPNVYER